MSFDKCAATPQAWNGTGMTSFILPTLDSFAVNRPDCYHTSFAFPQSSYKWIHIACIPL